MDTPTGPHCLNCDQTMPYMRTIPNGKRDMHVFTCAGCHISESHFTDEELPVRGEQGG